MGQAGDQLAVARSIGATSSATSPSSGGGRRQQLGRAASWTAAASARPSRTRPRSVLWAIPSPLSFSDDREAEALGRRGRAPADQRPAGREPPPRRGRPAGPWSRAPRACGWRPGQARAGSLLRGPAPPGRRRPPRCVPCATDGLGRPGGARGFLRDALDVGRTAARRPIMRRQRHDALRLRAQGRPASPAALARPVRPDRPRRVRTAGRRGGNGRGVRHLPRPRHRRHPPRRTIGVGGQGRSGGRSRCRPGGPRARRPAGRPARFGGAGRRPRRADPMAARPPR